MFGLGAVKKQEGRPARYVTRRTTVGLLPFYFPCHLLTSNTPLDMYHPPTYTSQILLWTPVPHIGIDGQHELDHEPEKQHEKNRCEWHTPAYQ